MSKKTKRRFYSICGWAILALAVAQLAIYPGNKADAFWVSQMVCQISSGAFCLVMAHRLRDRDDSGS